MLNKRILQYNYKMCSKTEFYVFRKLGILLIAVGQLTTNWFELPNNLALPKSLQKLWEPMTIKIRHSIAN